MQHTPVFITGVGRCGSSLVASMVSALGIDFGQSVPADEHNPGGYFEDREFVAVHETLLQGLLDWDKGEAMMRGLIVQRLRKGCRWGLKDPRLCYFLAFYANLFPFARWVICLRDPDQIVKSYQATYRMVADECRQIVESRWASFNLALANRPCLAVLFVKFEELLANPEHTLTALQGYLALPADQGRVEAALALVRPRDPAMTRPIPAPDDIHGLKVFDKELLARIAEANNHVAIPA